MNLRKRLPKANKAQLARAGAFSVLCLLGAWALLHFNSARQRNIFVAVAGRPMLVRLGNLPDVPLFDLQTSAVSKLELSDPRKKVLLVFMSTADCWSCLGELPAWKHLADKVPQSKFEEVFVIVRSNKAETLSLIRNNMFSHRARLYLDAENGAVSLLHLPEDTPLTVLIQGGNREVIAAEGKDSSDTAEAEFVNRVAQFVSAVSSNHDEKGGHNDAVL